jgi:hypothetical protein
MESIHIDDWINSAICGNKELYYAAFVLDYFRRPAIIQMAFAEFMKPHKLFCSYKGERYRVTGASRMGDVWLAKDFKLEHGYDIRVDVQSCSLWAEKPELEPVADAPESPRRPDPDPGKG